ncbi:MAG: oxygen-independent coproporphyrinogen III oxidase [Sphingobacteriales bacterium]|nr:oxygen-independent coproporphyrinogen III oxidase [Sphingobacteriales bacterium]
METAELIKKYTVPVPRYTSYPTVPYWDVENFKTKRWLEEVKIAFKKSNQKSGISLYIHLPYCESLCTYCGCNTRITKNHEVELPYIKALEIEWMMYEDLFNEKPQIKELHLGGGTPTFFSPENLKSLIKNILSGCEIHPEAEFSFEAHPANTSEAHLKVLYELGFKRLSLGIQDFDPQVQQIINRLQTVEQVEKVTQQARAIGYNSINYDLIYGLPLQTLVGLKNTIKEVIRLLPDRIAFYSYAHVPWIKPGQRMFTELDLPDADSKQLLYETGRNLLIEAGYEEIGMDHFALPTDSLYQAQEEGKLHRNFMGYTHQYTQLMIGLGVSSISDSWTAFAQNVKKVEDYISLVDAGEFPVFKGHLLDEDDLMMRRHILHLMCKGETHWDRLDLLHHHFKRSLYRLREVEQDGLIKKTDHAVKVTPLGRRFLRNICAAFDDRLWKNLPEKQVFSMGS